jgi:hypothetical protein
MTMTDTRPATVVHITPSTVFEGEDASRELQEWMFQHSDPAWKFRPYRAPRPAKLKPATAAQVRYAQSQVKAARGGS